MARSPEFAMTAAMLLVIGSVPLTQIAWEISEGERPHCLELFDRPPIEVNLRDFESDLEDRSWLTRFVRPIVQRMRFTLLGDPPAKLLAGRGGWLFYTPGVDYLVERPPVHPPPDAGTESALLAIRSFHDQLADRGIRLLLVVVPGKASVYPNRLTRRFDAGRVVDSPTKLFVQRLREAGIETVDLITTFRRARAAKLDSERPLFLSRDTHWTGTGVRLAAAAVAERVQQLGWIEPGTVAFETQTLRIAGKADLIKMMEWPRANLVGAVEEIHVFQVLRHGTPYQDDLRSPVLLLGDSFARIYQTDEPGSAGLAAHLAHQLAMPLTTIVNDGGASTLVRQQLVRQSELLEGKKLVIWEFVERDLRFGLEGWQEVTLPRGVN